MPPQPPRKKQQEFFPINIHLNTNIPSEKNEENRYSLLNTGKRYTLRGKMLDPAFEDIPPFMTTRFLYTKGTDYILSFPDPRDRAAIFFNRDKYIAFLNVCKPRVSDEETKNELENPKSVAHINIMFMLNVFIHISFPTRREVEESYIFPAEEAIFYINPWKPLFAAIKRLFVPRFYSYLKLDGKDYTIIRASWMNDFYTHPLYNNIYNTFLLYNDWYETERENIIGRFKDAPYKNSYFKETLPYNRFYKPEIVEYIVEEFGQNLSSLDYAKNVLTNILVMRPVKIYEYYDVPRNRSYNLEYPHWWSNTLDDAAAGAGAAADVLQGSLGDTNKTLPYSEYADFYKEYKTKRLITEKRIYTTLQNEMENEKHQKTQMTSTQISLIEMDYNDFVKFVEDIYNYFNGNDLWKNMIKVKTEKLKDISQNKYNKELKMLLQNLSSLSDVGVRNKIEGRNFYVGAQILDIEKPAYDIDLYVDVLGGEINNTNKKQIQCIYKHEKMGDELEQLLNRDGIIYNDRFFYDIGATADIPPPPPPRGGRTNKKITKNIRNVGGGKKNEEQLAAAEKYVLYCHLRSYVKHKQVDDTARCLELYYMKCLKDARRQRKNITECDRIIEEYHTIVGARAAKN